MRIGYVGLGAMGGALVRHLLGKHDVVVFDRNPQVLHELEALGARTASTLTELAGGCEVVVTCLPRSSDVEAVLFGTDGLAGHLEPGCLVIDQTTGLPGSTARFAERLKTHGVLLMDAPVSGGIPAAQKGAVTIIASGPDEAWSKGEPVLRCMSEKVLRCGQRVGDGQALKLITNGIGACYRLATLELVALWRSAGMPLERAVFALNGSHGANFTSRNMLVGLVEGRSTTNFSMNLMVKDINGMLQLGEQTATPTPLTTAARGLMQGAIGLFGKQARLDDAIPFIERLWGVRLTDTETPAPNDKTKEMPIPDAVSPVPDAIAACNIVALREGVIVGLRYGLRIEDITKVVIAGSAWCEVAEHVLTAGAAGNWHASHYGRYHEALRAAAAMATETGYPFIMPGIALSVWQNTMDPSWVPASATVE